MPVPDLALLDNPIWNSLVTEHAHLAQGDNHARRYPPEIGPLAGIPAPSPAAFDSLRQLAGAGIIGLLSLQPFQLPPGWKRIREGALVQMIRHRTDEKTEAGVGAPSIAQSHRAMGGNDETPSGNDEIPGAPSIAQSHRAMGGNDESLDTPSLGTSPLFPSMGFTNYDGSTLRQLTPADAPAMVDIAHLTEPGPFHLRTIELGNFYGIFWGHRLVSMAGKRMHLPGLQEVSGVCTHPDARGRGYARQLMSIVIEEIESEGKTAFLHMMAENPAVRLYEQLGFALRQRFDFVVLAVEQ